jgi:hypothetical protein
LPAEPTPPSEAKAGAVQRAEKLVDKASDERTPEHERRNAGVALATIIAKHRLTVTQ